MEPLELLCHSWWMGHIAADSILSRLFKWAKSIIEWTIFTAKVLRVVWWQKWSAGHCLTRQSQKSYKVGNLPGMASHKSYVLKWLKDTPPSPWTQWDESSLRTCALVHSDLLTPPRTVCQAEGTGDMSVEFSKCWNLVMNFAFPLKVIEGQIGEQWVYQILCVVTSVYCVSLTLHWSLTTSRPWGVYLNFHLKFLVYKVQCLHPCPSTLAGLTPQCCSR